ncbi:acyl-CoA dehydrogenase family protein [Peptococcus simiae]|uniref:acyl-CoA dehydrogenase family protein n=1 Tax=Peptococcus simiae TaxID=1643805 RepID=UPI00397EAEEE
MRYKVSPENEKLRQEIRAFAESEIAPLSFQLDERGIFPEEIVKKMGEKGWMGLPFEKKYGGQEMGNEAYAIAVEEFSRIDASVGVILSAHNSLGTWPIAAFGTEEQKQKYLVPCAKGEKLAAFGLTEENAGSDAGGTETTAVLDGDDYILNGTKIFITNAPEADVYVVFAATDKEKGTHGGITAFIVEKGTEGFSFGTRYNKMGIRASATAELVFKNCRVPKENLLGEVGQGFKIAMMTLDGGRIGIAAQALGIAQGAYEQALERAQDRVQFGKPIAAQQGVSFKLADMATKIRAARFLVYSAAEMKDAHENYGMQSAMAKLYASDIALEVVDEAVQIFGGAGFIKGLPVERFYRDAKITAIYEGTNEIQRVVIASHLMPRKKKDKPAKKDNKAPAPQNERKMQIFDEGSSQDRVDALVKALKEEGFDKQKVDDIFGPIGQADRLVAFGMGLKHAKDREIMEKLAQAFGAVLSCSRPISEEREWMDLTRYVGLSGQKFAGQFYLGAGISGQKQHMYGIKDTRVIVAINDDPHAPIFAQCDYGIVGDMYEIIPLLTEALEAL